MVGTRIELQELVDSPNESLEAEYKEWLDLVNSNEARANLARHLAALSNFGGGNIIIGFTDAMQFAGPNPHPHVSYDHDLIAGIVKKYLEPPFQCNVFNVQSSAGNEHPVIVVPPHGPAPVCAKAGGPMVDGKSKGIVGGTYYIRKPGPESAPILTASEWAPIIRRCVTHDKSAILAAVDAALRGSVPGIATPDALKQWHDAAHTRFLKTVSDDGSRPNLAKWHWQLSYSIDGPSSQHLEPDQLIQTLREVNREVTDLVQTGWSMFHIFTRPDLQPFFETDLASGQGERDFLECSVLAGSETGGADLWRVSADGKATLIRDYWEDEPIRSSETAGTLFSPNMLATSLAEFVRHGRGVAERFDSPSTVSFRCE